MAPFALGSLGVKSFPRHSSLLGALAFRALYVIARTGSLGFKMFHVTVRSWKPWCSELFTSLSVFGSLGNQSWSRH